MRTRRILRTEVRYPTTFLDLTKIIGSDQEEEIAPREKASSMAATKKPAKHQLVTYTNLIMFDKLINLNVRMNLLIQIFWTPNLSRMERNGSLILLAKKIAFKEKPKKAPPKKLTKTSDLMMGGSGASKAPPDPRDPQGNC